MRWKKKRSSSCAEVAATFERPGLLFSSARTPAWCCNWPKGLQDEEPGHGQARRQVAFPLVHVDTGHNFPEVIEFRESRVKKSASA